MYRPHASRFLDLSQPEGDTSFDPLFVSASGLWMVVSLGPVAYAGLRHRQFMCRPPASMTEVRKVSAIGR